MIEDISAVNKNAKPILNVATGDIQIKISMKSFIFKSPLMQEHFNETYVESEKYPYAFLRGKVNEKIDYAKDGEYAVTVTGKMEIHGVEKERSFAGTLKVKDDKIYITSDFDVKLADYNIDIPSLQKEAISESIDIKVAAMLEPFKKTK